MKYLNTCYIHNLFDYLIAFKKKLALQKCLISESSKEKMVVFKLNISKNTKQRGSSDDEEIALVM